MQGDLESEQYKEYRRNRGIVGAVLVEHSRYVMIFARYDHGILCAGKDTLQERYHGVRRTSQTLLARFRRLITESLGATPTSADHVYLATALRVLALEQDTLAGPDDEDAQDVLRLEVMLPPLEVQQKTHLS